MTIKKVLASQEKHMIMFEKQKNFIRPLMMLSVLVLSIGLLPYVSADGGGTYSVYDTDRDGYLDRTEYEQFYESKRKRAKNLDNWVFDNVDSNADNRISEQEMVDALIKNRKQK
jgi:hypothetical protein